MNCFKGTGANGCGCSKALCGIVGAKLLLGLGKDLGLDLHFGLVLVCTLRPEPLNNMASLKVGVGGASALVR
jgi:hypothetical protein